MEWVVELINTTVFPVAMCIILSYYVKYTNDTYYDNPITITVNKFTRVIEKCYAWKCMLGPIYHSPIVKNDKHVKPNKYIKDLIKAGYVEEIEWESE